MVSVGTDDLRNGQRLHLVPPLKRFEGERKRLVKPRDYLQVSVQLVQITKPKLYRAGGPTPVPPVQQSVREVRPIKKLPLEEVGELDAAQHA